jgi:hypothetical protein
MNLRSIANGATQSVNPNVRGMLYRSVAATAQPSGHRTPAFADPITLPMQVQMLTTREAAQLDGVNKAGSTFKIYMNGQVQGLNRATKSGGDKIQLLSGKYAGLTFLTTSVMEEWPAWTCVSATLQNK